MEWNLTNLEFAVIHTTVFYIFTCYKTDDIMTDKFGLWFAI
jgi:hypothetical protein